MAANRYGSVYFTKSLIIAIAADARRPAGTNAAPDKLLAEVDARPPA